MHIDSTHSPQIKVMLYLSDVDPSKGPFSIVPGSHRWDHTGDGRLIRRAFDKSKLVGRSEEKRRLFMSLPREYRLKAEFGGDLLAGDPVAEHLLGLEQVVPGSKGTLIAFDPRAIHRGGLVRKGFRQALQISLQRSRS